LGVDLENVLSRFTSCLVQVRRRFEADCEMFGAEKKVMEAAKAKVVQMENPMDGIHFVTD
jgi:hypothetical protein